MVHSRCRGFKVVKSCSQEGTSYSLVQTLLLRDASFSHNMQRHCRQTDKTDGQIDNVNMPIVDHTACSTIG